MLFFASSALAQKADLNPVYVRDSAVVAEKFALAQRMERLKEWNKAADVYQEVLAGYSDRVVASNNSGNNAGDTNDQVTQYVSVVSAVQERLSHWPADGVAAYRARFDVEAQTLLDAAKDSDLSALNKIFTTYFITEAGRTAGIRLIDTEIEAGEFAAAAWTAQRLLDLHPDLGKERPMLEYRAALAYHLCGEDQRAQDRLAALQKESPAALGHVRGQDVVLVDSLRGELAAPAPQVAQINSADSWPMAFGSADRARVAAPASKIGARMFALPLGRLDSSMRRQPSQLEVASEPDRAAGFYTGVFPAVDRGELYYQDNARLCAVSLESGLPLPGWSQTYEGEKNGAYVAAGCTPMPRGHVMTVSLTDDSALAIMGMSDARTVQLNGQVDLLHNTRLVCLDRATGKERWTARPAQLAAGAAPALASTLRELDLTGSPLVVGNNVYIQGRGGKGLQFEDCYVICADLGSGKLKWATYIASANVAGQFLDEYAAVSPQSMSYLAYSSGRIFCLTNLGAVAAIGAYDGTISWLDVYPREEQEGARRWPIVKPSPPRKPFTFNPVIVEDQKVFILPSDGKFLHIYDAGDGNELKRVPLSLVWESEDPSKPYERTREQLSMLIGVSEGRIIASSGRYILAFDWKKFDPQNVSPTIAWRDKLALPADDRRGGPGNPQGDLRIVGRPFLTRDQVIVPEPSRLQILSARAGGVVYNYPESHWLEDEGPGNVLAAGDYTVVAGPTQISVYADRDMAIRRLDAAVNAAPQDPQPRLRYAEVMFISGEPATALNKLDEAIALLGGRQSLAPGATRERLFTDLLTFARKLSKSASDENAEMIDGLFDRAVDAALTPVQQVNARLSRAVYARSRHDMATEMRLDQEILLQPAWRDLNISRDNTNGPSPAGLIASDAIDELLSRPDGPGFYAPYEKQASDLLEAGRAKNDPEQLLKVAASYPNASAARQALMLSADLFEMAGDPRRAVAVLRQLHLREQNSPDQIRIIESLARNYLAMPNRLDVAAARLSQLAKLHNQPKLSRPMRLPDGQILRDVTFADALAAVRKLQSHASESSLPDLHLPVSTSAAAFLPAEKSPVIDNVAALCVPGRQFARDDRVIAFSPATGICVFSPGAVKPIYTSNALTDAPAGVAWVGGNLLAWTDQKVVMLDGEGGQTVWSLPIASLPIPQTIDLDTPDADNAVSDNADAGDGDGGDGDAGVVINGGAVVINGNLHINNGQRLVIRGNGQVFINGQLQPRINVAGGRNLQVRARAAIVIPQPGQAQIGPPQPPPIDPARGEQIVAVAPLSDRAIIATSAGRVAAIDLTDGEVQWQSRPMHAPVGKLLASDEFVVARFDDGAANTLIALDALHGQSIYRNRFAVNLPTYLVNFTLADDGTLVWVLPDRVAAKDLFEPGDKLRFGERPARLDNQMPFAGAGGEDQLAIVGGRVLVVGDNGLNVLPFSLETGQQLNGAGATPFNLASGAEPMNASITQFRAVESRIYVSTTVPPKFSAYDLDRPGKVWDTLGGLDGKLLRDPMIGRNDLVLLTEVAPAQKVPPGHFVIYSYSRRRNADGLESGALLHIEDLNEPSEISAYQPVDGGIYYLSGDQKLHFLAGAGDK